MIIRWLVVLWSMYSRSSVGEMDYGMDHGEKIRSSEKGKESIEREVRDERALNFISCTFWLKYSRHFQITAKPYICKKIIFLQQISQWSVCMQHRFHFNFAPCNGTNSPTDRFDSDLFLSECEFVHSSGSSLLLVQNNAQLFEFTPWSCSRISREVVQYYYSFLALSSDDSPLCRQSPH